MTALLTFLALATAAGSAWLTLKAWSMLFDGDLVGWLALKGLGEFLAESAGKILASLSDN